MKALPNKNQREIHRGNKTTTTTTKTNKLAKPKKYIFTNYSGKINSGIPPSQQVK